MRAVRVHTFGAAPSVDLVDAPAGGPGLTTVQMTAASIAHLDRSVASGTFLSSPPLPYLPGAEGSGHVLTSSVHPIGALVWLRGAGLGVARDGTCAEVVAVPDGAVHVAPPAADPVLAACFFSPATTAAVAVHELGGLRPGERLAVTGAAGAVGSLVVQLGTEAGAAEVVGTVSRPERRAEVPPGARVLVGDLPPDGSVDLLVDTIGGPGLPARLAAVRPGGRCVLVGYTAGAVVELDLPTLMQRDVALLPVNMIRRAPQAFGMADGLLMRLSNGELVLPTSPYPLAAVESAWQSLGDGSARGRVVLTL